MPSAETTAARADLFRLLAVGLLHPSKELAEGLVDGAYAADLQVCAGALPWPADRAASVLESLRTLADVGAGRELEALYHELAVEYARLFIGPGPVVVSPYESIHRDQHPDAPALLMVSRSATQVAAAYREAGLQVRSAPHEPPDHVAAELEFLYYLGFRESGALAAGQGEAAGEWRERRVAFARDHLREWIPGFCAAVSQASPGTFYAALAEVVSEAVAAQ